MYMKYITEIVLLICSYVVLCESCMIMQSIQLPWRTWNVQILSQFHIISASGSRLVVIVLVFIEKYKDIGAKTQKKKFRISSVIFNNI